MTHLHSDKAWFSPRSHTYGAAAYLSCVSKENFVTQTLEGIGGREKATHVLRTFKLVGKRRWGFVERPVCSEDLSCFVRLFKSPSLFMLSLLCSVMLEEWGSSL